MIVSESWLPDHGSCARVIVTACEALADEILADEIDE